MNIKFKEMYNYANIKPDDFPCYVEIGYQIGYNALTARNEETLHFAQSEKDLLDYWEQFCKENNLNPFRIEYIYKR